MGDDDEFKAFEDVEDFLEDLREPIRESIRRYTIYYRAFMLPQLWKEARSELKAFVNYEIEKIFREED